MVFEKYRKQEGASNLTRQGYRRCEEEDGNRNLLEKGVRHARQVEEAGALTE